MTLAMTSNASPIVSHLKRSAACSIGLYSQMKNRLSGLALSGFMRPRRSQTIRTGTTVTDRTAPNAMA